MVRAKVLGQSESEIAEAAAALRRGELVAFPTDTVYGVGTHAFLADSVARIYTVKGRGERKPIAILLADAEDLAQVATQVPAGARRLAARYWPGALTLVLTSRPDVPEVVRGGGLTIGVRVPDHEVARALIRAAGVPIATTSANLSGHPSPTLASQVLGQLGDALDYVVEGTCHGGVESTVVDCHVDPPIILREGALSRREIEAVLR